MVLSATLRTVLSSTIAIRLVISTPRMTHRRRYTLGSVSASGATPEEPDRGEVPGASIGSPPPPGQRGGPCIPGRPGAPPREGQQYGTGPYRKTFPVQPGRSAPRVRGCRGYPPPGPRGMLKASGDATAAPRGRRISHDRTAQ